MAFGNWLQIQVVPQRNWTCGYCGAATGNDRGYPKMNPQPNHQPDGRNYIVVCPVCEKPTFFGEDGKQTPGARYGEPVLHLPKNVGDLYDEARNCMIVSAFTACCLTCRKVLMNIAVTLGAPENVKFEAYVKYLADNGHVATNAKGWVDHIRKKGNEATHEIPAITKEDAEDTLTFTEMLLKTLFEYPQRVPKPS